MAISCPTRVASYTIGAMNHIEWLDQTLGDDSRRHAASLIGMPTRTFATQVKKGTLPAETVIAVAAAYKVHPVRALVDTDYLDPQWAETVDPITALRQVSEEDLADEVLRRMKLPGAHETFDTPVDELDARRSAKSNDRGQDDTPDEHTGGYDPLRHVAYNGMDEDKLRETAEHGEDYDWTDPDQIP
jgi:hypothetical protein